MKKQQTIDPTNGTHETKTMHALPDVLHQRIASEREIANAKIQQIQQDYRQRVQLIIDGYSASLDPNKNYTLSNDLKHLIEQ